MSRYCRPQSLAEVIAVLGDANGHGRILVGGTDLLVHLRRDPFAETVVIDIKAADDLPPPIETSRTAIAFGPTATMADLVAHPRVRDAFPALVEAANVVGSVAIRNRASLIGNICNASPAADTAPALLVYGASVTILGQQGLRTMPLHDFFVGPGATQCGAGEIVVQLTVPIPPAGFGSAFERLTRRRGVDLATVSVAAGVDMENRVVLAFGCVGPTPLLSDTSPAVAFEDDEALAAGIEPLVTIAAPISDVRAGADYRRAMVRVLSTRAVRAAARRTSTRGAT